MRCYALKYLFVWLIATGCMCIQATAQQPSNAKSAKIDSIPTAITGSIRTVAEKGVNEVKQLPSLAKQAGSQLIAPEKRIMDSLLQSGKSMITSVLAPVDLFKKGGSVFKLNAANADFEYTYLHDTSGMSTGLLNTISSTIGYNAQVNLTIANMPFDFRFTGNNGIYDLYHTPYNNFPQFNFNHKQYLESLQKQVLDKISPDAVLSSVLTRINSIKNQYEATLKNEIKSIQRDFETEFGNALQLPSHISDLSVNDLTTLKSNIIPQEVLEEYKQGTAIYQELSSGDAARLVQNDSIKNSALQSIKKYEALQKIYGKVTGWKQKFDNNALVKELRSHLPFTPGNFKSYLRKPSNLIDVVKKHANLSSLQELFLNITKLDIGTNPLQGGELDAQSLMNKGINAEYTTKRSSAGFIYGSGSANVNNWMQAGLNSFQTNEYSRMTGIKFGSGWNSNVKQSVSLNFYDFNSSQDLLRNDPSTLQSGYVSGASHRDAIITWQSSMDVAPGHKISVDLSRSFGSYRNNTADDSSVTKTNAFNDVFSGSGKSNYAAKIDYDGNLLNTDLQLSLQKTGLGYNNPGNVFLRRGETRFGLGLSRRFLKQKLTVRYKTDFRSQQFDPSKNYTYHNFSNNVQLGYRLKRNTRVGITIRQNSYRFNTHFSGSAQTRGASFSLQSDANYAFRIADKKVINSSSVSTQRFDMPMLNGAQYASKTWLLTQSSSVMLKRNLLTLTLLANKSNNKDYYFNTSFISSEVNYAYAIGEKIRLGSGMGYYANTGWNQQIGLKQQISGTILKKLDIDIDATWKKAVKIIRPELANQVYISSSVHYRF